VIYAFVIIIVHLLVVIKIIQDAWYMYENNRYMQFSDKHMIVHNPLFHVKV
jgi:hypothetical protein